MLKLAKKLGFNPIAVTVDAGTIILPNQFKHNIKDLCELLDVKHQYISADYSEIIAESLNGKFHPCGKCSKKTEELNSYNSKLKENSFGNKLLKSVLAGLSEGLKQAALKSVTSLFTSGSGNSSTPTPSTATSQPARVQSGSTPTSESKSLSSNVQNRIRQVEKNIENETRYLENAEKRYNSNPSSAAKREIDAHKRAIEGYKRQIEELKK